MTSENLPLVTATESSKCKMCWSYIKGCFACCIGVLVVVAITIAVNRHHHQSTSKKGVQLTCFECYAMVGRKVEVGLPYEEHCEYAPKNSRKCLQGEKCGRLKMTMGQVTRFQRACFATQIVGCSSRNKPNNITTCFCATNLCV